MNAVVFHGPRTLSIEETKVPRAGPGELVVATKVALTCGTDLKMYNRGHPYAKPPIIMGHEFAGIISQVGEKVTGFKEGMRVVAANSAPCGECYYCQHSQENLCDYLSENILGFSHSGAYADYVKIPSRIVARNTIELEESIDFKLAACVEPLACALHGFEVADMKAGQNVVILGAGPIGLLHIQLAKMYGASSIINVARSRKKLSLAKRLGASNTIVANEEQIEEVKRLTDGRGADLVIEAVGLPQTWETAFQITRKGGKTMFFGGCPAGASLKVEAYRVHYEEMTLLGSFHHTPGAVRRALGMITSGEIEVSPLITHDLPLSRTADAFAMMSEGRAMKVALFP